MREVLGGDSAGDENRWLGMHSMLEFENMAANGFTPLGWYTVISLLLDVRPMAQRDETPIAASAPTSNVLTTRVDPTSARFEANMRFLADLMSQIRNEGEKICEGGGPKAIENQHAKGRLIARERIDKLVYTLFGLTATEIRIVEG